MKFFEVVAFVFAVCCIEVNGKARELPPYLELCQRKLPKDQLEKCLIKNVEILRPHLEKGIPGLFIPSVSPLAIPQACLQNLGNFKACFSNLEIYNGISFQLKKANVDLDNYQIDLHISFPLVRIIADYKVNGRLLILELNGLGRADGNYTNVDLMLGFQGKSVKRRNKEYIAFDRQTVDLRIQKAHLYFENIFGKNIELNERANQIINDNIDSLIDEFKPVIAEIISKFIVNIVSGIFNRYPINELFPN